MKSINSLALKLMLISLICANGALANADQGEALVFTSVSRVVRHGSPSSSRSTSSHDLSGEAGEAGEGNDSGKSLVIVNGNQANTGHSAASVVGGAAIAALGVGSVVCFNKPACRRTFANSVRTLYYRTLVAVMPWLGMDPTESSNSHVRVLAQQLYNPADFYTDSVTVPLNAMAGRTPAAVLDPAVSAQ